ncbi:MAG TPA: ABC transporter substrate-binding protein [Clostridia bacterium]|nr:ABC transporter substrate-binding protein [Clostridia bacterium]
MVKRLTHSRKEVKVGRLFGSLVVMLVIAALLFGITGCSSKPQNEPSEKSGSTASSESTPSEKAQTEKTSPVRIGIVQIADHPALDASREGFKKALADLGYKEGETVVYDEKSAGGDTATALTICQKFVADKVDLILAIATPAAQAAATATTEIPILFTAVTDPVVAKLVKSIEKPGTNLTGTSDLTPVARQIELLKELKPDIKRVGIIYNAGEPNSVVQAELARKACEKLGLQLVEATPTSINEVAQAAQSLVGRVDAVYVPTCNTAVAGIDPVIAMCEKNKLPLVTGERGPVDKGALATDGIDYFNLGYQTGKMADEVLKGADPSEMPVGYLEDLKLIINLKTAQKIGLEIPDSIKNRASEIIQ